MRVDWRPFGPIVAVMVGMGRCAPPCTIISGPWEQVEGPKLSVDFSEHTSSFSGLVSLVGNQPCRCLRLSIPSNESKLSQALVMVQEAKIGNKSITISGPRNQVINDSILDIHRSYRIILADGQMSFGVIPKSKLRFSQFTLTYAPIWPYVIMGRQLSGSDIDILQALQDKYGFQYETQIIQNMITRTLDNGTVVGYEHKIATKQYDFGMGQLMKSSARRERVDFGVDMAYRDLGFSSAPASKVDKFDTLILPFSLPTWIGLLVCTLAIWMYLGLVDYIQSGKVTIQDMNDSWVLAITVLIQESQPFRMFEKTQFVSRWCLVTLWLILGFFLAMFYESSLLATLTIVAYKKPVDTPQEIIDSDMTVFCIGRTILSEGLINHPLPIYRELYEKTVLGRGGYLVPFVNDSAEFIGVAIDARKGIQVVSKDQSDSTPNRRYHREPYLVGTGSWMFTKQSNLKDIFDQDLVRLREAGIITHMEQNVVHQAKITNRVFEAAESTSKVEAEKIRLIHYRPIFVVIGFGWFMCSIVFMIEHGMKNLI